MEKFDVGVFIKQARQKLGLSQEELGLMYHKTKSSVSQWENNTYDPPLAVLLDLSSKVEQPILPLTSKPNITDNAYQDPDEEYTTIDLLEVVASAGHGSFINDERMKKALRVGKEWFNKLVPNNKNNIRAITAKGDSMEPTIYDGDILLVDTTRTTLTADGVYAFSFTGNSAVHVKRLLMRNKIHVVSDNKIYDKEEYKEAELVIHGKVVGVMSARTV